MMIFLITELSGLADEETYLVIFKNMISYPLK